MPFDASKRFCWGPLLLALVVASQPESKFPKDAQGQGVESTEDQKVQRCPICTLAMMQPGTHGAAAVTTKPAESGMQIAQEGEAEAKGRRQKAAAAAIDD